MKRFMSNWGIVLVVLGLLAIAFAMTCSAQVATPTHLTAVANAANHTTAVTPSISPSSDALIIAWIAFRATAGNVDISGMATTLTGVGSWTIVQGTWQGSTGGSDCAIAYAKITGAPGSGTVTWTLSGTTPRSYAGVAEIATGYHATTPILQSKSDTSRGLTLSITLTSALQANSKSFSVVSSRSGALILPGTGETELHEGSSGGTGNAEGQVQYSTDQAHDWTVLGNVSNSGLVIEIQPPAAAAPSRRKWIIK